MSIDESKLHELLGRAVVDFGAAFHAGLVVIGDKLGLYKALDEGGPMTPAELAEKTGTAERYVREWLSCEAAGGYVTYDGGVPGGGVVHTLVPGNRKAVPLGRGLRLAPA